MEPPESEPRDYAGKEGPYDEPGNLPEAPNLRVPSLDYRRQRLNQVVRSGGRGCFVGAIAFGVASSGVLLIARL